MNIITREIERSFHPMELALQMYSAEDFKMLRKIFESSKTSFEKRSEEMELINQMLDHLKLKVIIDNDKD